MTTLSDVGILVAQANFINHEISTMIRIIQNPDVLPRDATLWRYMRISTLLMLLRGKLFVPTIKELRHGDPMEAKYLSTDTKDYFDDLHDPDREWLLRRATPGEREHICKNGSDSGIVARSFLGIWDREISQRRRIWCWHQAEIESMALWHIYAREGVAIRSTPERIMEAFDPWFVDQALIGRVDYASNPCSEFMKHCYMRPYLIKQRCYEHEREVRVIIPRNSDDSDERRLLPINARKLIAEVRISPNIHRSEALEVRQSLISAGRTGDESIETEDDLPIFVSDTKTVINSQSESLSLNNREETGIACFGSNHMPFVMNKDFASH